MDYTMYVNDFVKILEIWWKSNIHVTSLFKRTIHEFFKPSQYIDVSADN